VLPKQAHRPRPGRILAEVDTSVRTAAVPGVTSVGLTTEGLIGLQTTAGNQSVLRALSRRRSASLARSPQDGLAAPDDFNPISRAHDLIRAIDQSDTRLVPLSKAQELTKVSDDDVVSMGMTGSFARLRNVDVDDVLKALEGLTPSQVKEVDRRYAAEENGRGLEEDLFRNGESGHPTNLTHDDRTRITALLQGTKPDTGGPAAGSTDARITADAVELHKLLSDDLDEAQTERLMALHRRPVAEISRLDAEYERLYGLALGVQEGELLKGLQRLRLAELRNGDTAKADACAIEDKRRQIEALDEKYPDPPQYVAGAFYNVNKGIREKQRKELIGGIDAIVETDRREATAEAAEKGTSSALAVQERLGAVLGVADGDGGTLGGELAKTLGPSEGGAIAAMAAGASAPETAAQQLIEMEATDSTTHEKVSALMSGLRAQARQDLIAKARDPSLSPEQKQELQAHPEDAADKLAKEYTSAFRDDYDRARGKGRSFDDIVASASDADADMMRELLAGGGMLTPVQELDHAIRAKDVDAIKKVLQSQRTREQVDALATSYEQLPGHGNLRQTLFGELGAEKAATLDKFQYFKEAAAADNPDDPVAAMYGTGKEQLPMLSGRDAALADEALQRPERLGGAEEVDWLAGYGHRELEATEANKGWVGGARSLTGDPETEVLMKHSAEELVALQAEWRKGDPWGRPRQQILAEMRHWRATLTGDASAYEAENAAIVEEIKGAVTLAVQIAISLVVPGLAEGFIAQTLLNVGATIASNMVIQGDQYSLTMLRNDLLGGGLGALGGKLGEEVVGGIADAVAGEAAVSAGAAAEKAGVSTAIKADEAAAMAAKGSLALQTAKFAGSTTFATVGTSVGTGQDLSLVDFEKAFGLGLLTKGLHAAGVGGPATPGAPETAGAGEPAGGTRETTGTAGGAGHDDAVPSHIDPASEPTVSVPAPGEGVPTEIGPDGDADYHGPAPSDGVPKAIPGLEPTERAPASPYEKTGKVEQPDEPGPPKSATSGSESFGEEPTQREAPMFLDERDLEEIAVDLVPAESVMSPGRPKSGSEARTMYRNCIAESPGREAAIYRNTVTGEYIVVQGNAKTAAVAPGEAPRSAGKVQRWKEILEADSDIGSWELQAHSHPSEASGVVHPADRYPSGAKGDMGAMFAEARAAGHARSSRIDYTLEEGPGHTDFGFNPDDPSPYWVDVAGLPAMPRRFATMEAYHEFLENDVGVDPGEVPESMSGPQASEPVAPTAARRGGSDGDEWDDGDKREEGPGGRRRGRSGGEEKQDLDQIKAVAKENRMDDDEERRFREFVEREKGFGNVGTGNVRGDFTFKELRSLVATFRQERGSADPEQQAAEPPSPLEPDENQPAPIDDPGRTSFTSETAFEEVMNRRSGPLAEEPWASVDADDIAVTGFEKEGSDREGQLRRVLVLRVASGRHKGLEVRLSVAWDSESGTYQDIHEASR
jgi:hypothetical protein